MRNIIVLLLMTLVATKASEVAGSVPAASASARSHAIKSRAGGSHSPPPTHATEPEIIADLIRYCASEVWSEMHVPPPSVPYSRKGVIQTAHRIGNVLTRQQVEGSSSTNPVDQCFYDRRTALYKGVPLLGPLEHLPRVQHDGGGARVRSRTTPVAIVPAPASPPPPATPPPLIGGGLLGGRPN